VLSCQPSRYTLVARKFLVRAIGLPVKFSVKLSSERIIAGSASFAYAAWIHARLRCSPGQCNPDAILQGCTLLSDRIELRMTREPFATKQRPTSDSRCDPRNRDPKTAGHNCVTGFMMGNAFCV
jgi:hypothetical protein